MPDPVIRPPMTKGYKKDVFRTILASTKISKDGCWEWQRCITTNGYGQIWLYRQPSKRTAELAHRVIFEAIGSSIPQGLRIDHKCRNRKCCNPGHLRFVTHKQNTLQNSESFAAVNARKTHCIRGHEFNEENTRVIAGRQRRCKKCDRMYHKEYDRRRSGRSREAKN